MRVQIINTGLIVVSRNHQFAIEQQVGKVADTGADLLDVEGKPVIIEFVGPESDEYLAANHENRKVFQARSLAGLEFDPAVEDANAIRSIVFCTKGWRGIPKAWLDNSTDETPLEFSRENARQLYVRLHWLRRQFTVRHFQDEPFVKAS